MPSAKTTCPICGFAGATVRTGSWVVCDCVEKAFETLTSSLLIQFRKSEIVVADELEGL